MSNWYWHQTDCNSWRCCRGNRWWNLWWKWLKGKMLLL